MHRASNPRNNIQLEALGDDDLENTDDQCIGEDGTANINSLRTRNKVVTSTEVFTYLILDLDFNILFSGSFGQQNRFR